MPENALGQSPRRRPYRPQRSQSHQSAKATSEPQGIRQFGNPRQLAANARNNYERYSTLVKEAARRGETVEAENLYQHAEHYFRIMRELGQQA
jgi:Domain of unknown function (DUF4167)